MSTPTPSTSEYSPETRAQGMSQCARIVTADGTREARMASKDKGVKSTKKVASKDLKQKRQAKRDKKAAATSKIHKVN